MLNFNNEPGTFLAQKSGGAIQQSVSFLKKLLVVTLFCALSFMLSAPSLVQAEDLQQGTPAEQPSTNVQPVNTADPAELITSAASENQAPAKTNTQADDGLEISPENVGQPVGAAKNPTVNHVSIGDKTVSGKLTIGAGQRKSRKLDVTIRVIVNRQAGGTEEKTVTIPYATSSQNWTVTLDSELAEGDTVTVKQEYGGESSEGVVLKVKKSLADQHKDKIKMPSGEIWIEHTNSNQINNDEQAEAIEMLKKANPDIANDFESVVFSIDGTDHAYYEVTYTDGSTSGKIEAPDLKIKTVTEYSAAPTIEKVQVTDGQIIVTLAKEVAPGTKFYFVKNFTDGEDKKFGEGGRSCNVDKSTSQEMSQAVSIDGKKVTFPINNDDIKLKKEFGILVKEPHKFRSCAKSEPVITTPDKVAVRDPHKLTDDDKKAIDKAIRDANTVNGKSKLPDGTGFIDDPAFIEFDKDGNVTIISPNDVKVDDWDSNGNPIYTKNPDGTYKLKSGKENNVTKFPAKDLVKNIAPESPVIAVDTDKGEVTITPPAYEKAGEDTDLASYTITYKDASGAEKTVTVKRTVDGDGKTTWSSDDTTVDAKTGVVTLKVEDIEVGGTITATATDNGGLEGDTNPLTSDPASKELETATVSYDRNGGTGDMDSKKLNKGAKYKILSNDFTAPANEKFKAWKIGDTEYAAGDEITVKEDTSIQAVWQDIKVTVSYSPNGGSGSMDSATMKKGSKYTLLESTFTAPDDTQEFKAWEVDGKEVAAGTEITVDKDTEVKAIWKKIPVTVSYDANGGSGEMKSATVDKGSEYTVLPNGFTAPDDTQEFDTWEVNGEKVAPGTAIKADKDTVIKAIWKKITKYKVTFDGNGGTGKMDEKTVKKGDSYKLPANGFTPPTGKEFKGWEIAGEIHKVGENITVTGDVTVKALWKNKPVPPSTTPGKDKSGNQAKPQPKPQKQNPTAGANLSKTGANGMYSLYASLLLLATGGLFVISRRRRNQR